MHLSFVILLILLERTLARCPSELVIEPCKCSESAGTSFVTCKNFENFDDLQKVFDESLDYSFDTLSLESCSIPHLNSTWISAKNTKTLFVSDTNMIDLIDDIDITLPSIGHIAIGSMKILRRLRWQHFRPFTQLTTLAITDTEVKKLGKDFGSYVSSRLGLLNIVGAGVKVLKKEAFKGKTQLYSISFRRNRIKVLKKSFFEDQKSRLSSVDFRLECLNEGFGGYERAMLHFLKIQSNSMGKRVMCGSVM